MSEKKIELLAPAGDMERLEMAVAYGADAVYLAGTTFGMRSFAGNFTPEELKRAVALCHKKGVRVHVTCNTMPRNDEVARLPEWLTYLDQVGVDAVILADVGVMALAGKYAPHVQRHISTQASIVNYETARAWHDLGADRVILARELSLDEIREIRAKTPPELELEAFAHGAMCVSYSGRCLLSNYMTGRDSNRGACAQPCRYHYALMEEKRPGEYFPVYEDEKGTYIMNSRDMCTIDHLPEQFTEDSRYIRDWQIVAKVRSCTPDGRAVLTLNNKFSVGDQLELVGPGLRPCPVTVKALWDEDGQSLDQVRKPQMVFQLDLPCQAPPLSLLRRQADLTP